MSSLVSRFPFVVLFFIQGGQLFLPPSMMTTTAAILDNDNNCSHCIGQQQEQLPTKRSATLF